MTPAHNDNDDEHGGDDGVDGEYVDPRTDPIFGLDENQPDEQSRIFRKPELLDIEEVPESSRIVGRDTDIEAIGSNLRNMLDGGPVKHMLIWGETGTGKTLVSRHVCSRLEDSSAAFKTPVASVYLNCDTNSSFTSTFQKIATQINEKASAEHSVSVPYTGLSAEQYRTTKLWPVVEVEFTGGVVVILDELDKHPEIWDVLYTLTRAKSKDNMDIPVVVIGISNDIHFRDEIEARVESTLQPDHQLFSPYSKQQITEILENRRDAFCEGVVQDGVVEKTAELAAKEHGDARKAVRLLYNAGELAEAEGGAFVTTEHVLAVDEKVEIELYTNIIQDTALASKLLLFALAELDESNPDRDAFRTSEILKRYRRVCGDVREEPKAHTRVLQLLNKQALAGVIESSKTQGGRDGAYRSHVLLSEPDMVKGALIKSTPKLATLMSVDVDSVEGGGSGGDVTSSLSDFVSDT